jgi:glycosyltransferase involved in cell wall biosynthesis
VVIRFLSHGTKAGVVWTLLNLAIGLSLRGFNVTILTESCDGKARIFEKDGIVIEELPLELQNSDDLPGFYGYWNAAVKKRIVRDSESQIFAISTLAGLETFFKHELPDHLKLITYLVTDHVIQAQSRTRKNSKRLLHLKRLERDFLILQNNILVADSNAIVAALSKILELPQLPETSKVIHIGWPALTPQERIDGIPENFFLNIGTVSWRKGTRTLLSAWQQLESEETFRHYKLVICGVSGDDFLSELLIRKLVKRNRVVRLSNISEGQKSYLMKRCKAVVIPSNFESFGIVGLEAMSAGKLIVSTREGGLDEVLPQTILEFKARSTSELISQLKQSVSSSVPTYEQQLAKFRISRMIEAFESLITS